MMIPKPTRSMKTVTKRIGSTRRAPRDRVITRLARSMHVGPWGQDSTMAKIAIQHVCRDCGFRTAKWFGKCGGCGAFGSVEEEESRPRGSRALSVVLPIDQVPLSPGRRDRTGIGELDRALGGGLVPGGVVLLAGDPWIGESTLLLSALHRLAGHGPVLYVSGEESLQQIGLRG